MKILGIDPSLTCTGWAIVEDGRVVESGTIKTSEKDALEQRLDHIRIRMMEIIKNNDFTYAAIEDCFASRNSQVVIKLGKVHGIVLSCLLVTLYYFEIKVYAPAFVKKTITGSGRADKEQVLKMVQLQSGYKGKQLDESDAIAVALTCEREISNPISQLKEPK